MKKILLILSLSLASFTVFAQDTATQKTVSPNVTANVIQSLTLACTDVDFGDFFGSTGLSAPDAPITERGNVGALGSDGGCTVTGAEGTDYYIEINGAVSTLSLAGAATPTPQATSVSVEMDLETSTGTSLGTSSASQLISTGGTDTYILTGQILATVYDAAEAGPYASTMDVFISVN